MNAGRKFLVKWRKRSSTSTRWQTAKERPTEEDVRTWNGDSHEEARNIEYANGVKIVGHGSSLGSESTLCSIFKMCRKAQPRRKRDETTAKNEGYEGHDKENQSERKNVCEQHLGRLVNCWLPTATKLGSMQNEKMPLKNGSTGWVR